MANQHSTTWTPTEISLLEQIYPFRGAKACAAVLPGKSLSSITQTACRYGIKYLRPERPPKKPRVVKEKPYADGMGEGERVREAEVARLCRTLQDFGYITRRGDLIPTIGVSYDEAA